MRTGTSLLVDVEHPALAAVNAPLGDEILDGLLGVVSRDVHEAGIARAAHGDVGELPAAAVGEDVGPVDGRSLHAVDSHGVGVAEAVTTELLADEYV